jgi:hypothetical protein
MMASKWFSAVKLTTTPDDVPCLHCGKMLYHNTPVFREEEHDGGRGPWCSLACYETWLKVQPE